jgi:hypothetical protein
MDKNGSCNICKRRAYIACEFCENPTYFCSRGHLHSHKLKLHNGKSSENTSFNFTTIQNKEEKEPQIDMRRLFEHLQALKGDVETNIKGGNYVDAILGINKCMSIAKKFYEETHLFVKVL